MSTIREIFFNQITLGSDKWEPYLDVYEMYFSRFVGRAPTIVEVGVQSGGSLQLWRRYFGPDAQIWGLDIDPGILKLRSAYDSNTHLLVGDQADPAFWDRVFEQISQIDIFIDDGGHLPLQHRVTFENVFPRLKNGGVFICEDTHTCYMHHLNVSRKHPDSFVEYAKNLADLLHTPFLEDHNPDDTRLLQLTRGLRTIHFYNSMIVFMKGTPQEFRRVLVNK